MIKCVKSVVKFSGNIIAAIGLVILCFGLFVLYNEVGLDYQDLYYNSADWLKTLQEYGFIIIGTVIFLIGCTGVHGARQKPKCQKTCLMIYQIGAITFFMICTSLAIFTLLYSNDIFGKECKGTVYFEEIDSQIKLADQLLCSSQCQCYITQETLNLNQKAFAGKNYTTKEDLEIKIKQVQKCPSYQIDQYAASAQVMQAAEKLLHCSGWCNPTKYYIFSDINDNSNEGQSCFKETKYFVESTGKIMGYILLGLGILFGLNVFLVILLCCKKENRNRIDYLMYET
ncbi:unnamed protein product [Paramecium pentaurelia]|uniref:Tetraspanin family protein n=1 Tax=Paramecium pentaurelia TaxID=43138 RepID=A0A8S1S7E9_9CILI|nr:unnamed protein product [Paramecium pentaurelia]